jgi:hypothetical protein
MNKPGGKDNNRPTPLEPVGSVQRTRFQLPPEILEWATQNADMDEYAAALLDMHDTGGGWESHDFMAELEAIAQPDERRSSSPPNAAPG